MRMLFIAAAFLLSSVVGAAADSRASGQNSADLSTAVGDSVAKGTALVGLSVAVPLISLAGVGGSIGIVAMKTLSERTKHDRRLPIADETIVRGPAPNEALKTRHEGEI